MSEVSNTSTIIDLKYLPLKDSDEFSNAVQFREVSLYVCDIRALTPKCGKNIASMWSSIWCLV